MQQRFAQITKVFTFILAFLFIQTVFADDSVKTPASLYSPILNTAVGNPNGKVTLVEFFDYNCGYCHQMPGIFAKIMKNNPNVRIVYRDYPVLGDESLYAARAVLAAAIQNKYIQMHEALFSTDNPFTPKTVAKLANKAGVDSKKMTRDIKSAQVEKHLHSNAEAAADLQINGVPVVVVAATPSKGQKTVNAYVLTAPSYEELNDAIGKVSKG